MTTPEPQKSAPILDLAWKRYTTLSSHSARRNSDFLTTRRLIAISGILATLIAILTQVNKDFLGQYPGLKLGAQILFVATPILASTLAAFASKKYTNGDWWITRAAAEQIKREIFYYRTIWPKDKRGKMLEDSLEKIQRQVYRALGGMFTFEEQRKKKEKKPAPPAAEQPEKIDRDPKYTDLTADEYFKYRVEDQLKWHTDKMKKFKADQDRLTIFILLIGALGTVLATLGGTLGGNWGIWVALTASIATALIGWEQLRNHEAVVRNYSKVVLELNILKDHWVNVEPARLKPEEYDKEFQLLVNGCETVLWAQNTEYIKAMQDVLKDNSTDEQAKAASAAIDQMKAAAQDAEKLIQEGTIQVVTEAVNETKEMAVDSYQATLESLKEDGTELLQKQLDSASQAVAQVAENFVERTPTLTSALEKVKQDHPNIDVGRDTSKEQLNEILARYPKTGEVKG